MPPTPTTSFFDQTKANYWANDETMVEKRVVQVSAPGKILLAGGYLVLEAPNVGLVIAVDKRFTCKATFTPLSSTKKNDDEEDDIVSLSVSSPQFDNATWKYDYNRSTGKLAVRCTTEKNTFLEKTLRVALLYLNVCCSSSSIDLEILADNDFYSLLPHLEQRKLPVSLESVQSLPCHLPAPTKEGKVLKTGLGSSACLVTSVVAALCFDAKQESVISNLAQVCHCHAQGKIGSGFDVSAACHGAHIFQRSPKTPAMSLLLQLLEEEDSNKDQLVSLLNETIQGKQWQGDVVPITQFPPMLQVMLGDIMGGSESPSMAKTVLKWKAEADDIAYWNTLRDLNERITELFQQLAIATTNSPLEQELQVATTHASTWQSQHALLYDLYEAFGQYRRAFKSMGEAANVPIEPESQTLLCNATMELPGVVTCLVPGAGGYDAIACLYINDESVRQGIAQLWSERGVCPLAVQATHHGVRLEKS
jgi:phosphomevalonate kinase